MSFAEASAVTGGNGAWKASIPDGWDIFGATNGGFLMATASRAMAAEVPGRELISATGMFLNPGRSGRAIIEVTPLKAGRTYTMLRATVHQEGRPLVEVTAALAEPDRKMPDHDLIATEPPEIPPPEQCVVVEPAGDAPLPPPFAGKVELRAHPEDAKLLTGEKTGEALVRGWFRLRDGETMDAHTVVMATDALPPAIFNSTYPAGWTPTVELTVQVRHPKPTGWLACTFRTRFVTGGMLEEDGEIWDQEGRPVALSRQLALVPR